jgi:hypothetical protein
MSDSLVLVFCLHRPSDGLFTRTECLENSSVQKLILNWNKLEGLICKCEKLFYFEPHNDSERWSDGYEIQSIERGIFVHLD